MTVGPLHSATVDKKSEDVLTCENMDIYSELCKNAIEKSSFVVFPTQEMLVIRAHS